MRRKTGFYWWLIQMQRRVLWGNRQWSFHCHHKKNSLLRLGKAACTVDPDLAVCKAAMSCLSREEKKVCRQIPLQAHWRRSKLCIVCPGRPVCFEPRFLWLCKPCFSRLSRSRDWTPLLIRVSFLSHMDDKKTLSFLRKSGRLYHKQQNSFKQRHYIHGLGQLHSKRS